MVTYNRQKTDIIIFGKNLVIPAIVGQNSALKIGKVRPFAGLKHSLYRSRAVSYLY